MEEIGYYNISVIIPTKNREEGLLNCLESLSSQLGEGDEIVIVNGGKQISIPEKFMGISSAIKIVDETTPGISVAASVGAIHAQGQILAFLQDDVVVSKNWLSNLRKWFDILENASAIGGTARDKVNKAMRESVHRHSILWKVYDLFFFGGRFNEFGIITSWGGFSIGEEAPLEPSLVTGLPGPNWAVRREAYVQVGGFERELKYNCWDGFFFIQLNRYGKLMYSVPDMVVDHYPPQKGSVRDPYFLTKDLYLFLRLLKPERISDKIRKILFEWLNIIFWLTSSTGGSFLLFEGALKGRRDGRRLWKSYLLKELQNKRKTYNLPRK